MRKDCIGGNFKMFKTIGETVDYCKKFKELVKDVKDKEIVLCVPATALAAAAKECKGTNIGIAAQNMYFEDKGAYTGEISTIMIKDAGAGYVLIGHSERRHVFSEKDINVQKKVAKALADGLIPILCVGEKLSERESGITNNVVNGQTMCALAGLSKEQVEKVIVAYEPVWAIGTGKVATPEDAQAVHANIRNLLTTMYDKDTAEKVRIIYGGSVKPDNARGLMNNTDIDGSLVGGASLDPETFSKIVKA